jgi:hypothetical protein
VEDYELCDSHCLDHCQFDWTDFKYGQCQQDDGGCLEKLIPKLDQSNIQDLFAGAGGSSGMTLDVLNTLEFGGQELVSRFFLPDSLMLSTEAIGNQVECDAIAGEIKVCNAGDYGETNWRGI